MRRGDDDPDDDKPSVPIRGKSYQGGPAGIFSSKSRTRYVDNKDKAGGLRPGKEFAQYNQEGNTNNKEDRLASSRGFRNKGTARNPPSTSQDQDSNRQAPLASSTLSSEATTRVLRESTSRYPKPGQDPSSLRIAEPYSEFRSSMSNLPRGYEEEQGRSPPLVTATGRSGETYSTIAVEENPSPPSVNASLPTTGDTSLLPEAGAEAGRSADYSSVYMQQQQQRGRRLWMVGNALFFVACIVVVAVTLTKGGDNGTTPASAGSFSNSTMGTTTPTVPSTLTSSPPTVPTLEPANNPTEPPVSWAQFGPDIDPRSSGDVAGWSVSVSGNGLIIAVGAPGETIRETPLLNGSVTVYEYVLENHTWTQLGDPIEGTEVGSDAGTAVALSNDGSIVAIGAPGNALVRVFEFTNFSWIQQGQDMNGSQYMTSGSSLSLSDNGNIVAIGASNFEDSLFFGSPGSVQVLEFDKSNMLWFSIGQNIAGRIANDAFGSSVSLSRDGYVVAVGAPYDDKYGIDSGQVQVFEYVSESNIWNQRGNTIGGESPRDLSGTTVSLSNDGTIVAIGAIWNSGVANDAGNVRVYMHDTENNAWSQMGQDIDGESSGDLSGWSISLSSDGQTIAIGSVRSDVNGVDSGSVRVLKYDSSMNSWFQLGFDIGGRGTGQQSGYSVALSGDGTIVTIGAPYGGLGDGQGSVQVFKVMDVRLDTKVTIFLQLDSSPYQTGWYLEDSEGRRLASVADGFYSTENATVVERVAVNGNIAYRFVITDTNGDGLCCNGFYSIHLGSATTDDTLLAYGDVFNYTDERTIVASEDFLILAP